MFYRYFYELKSHQNDRRKILGLKKETIEARSSFFFSSTRERSVRGGRGVAYPNLLTNADRLKGTQTGLRRGFNEMQNVVVWLGF